MSLDRWNSYKKMYGTTTGAKSSGGSFYDEDEERRRAKYNQYANEVSDVNNWDQYQIKYNGKAPTMPNIKDSNMNRFKALDEARKQERAEIEAMMPDLEYKKSGSPSKEIQNAKKNLEALSKENQALINDYMESKNKGTGKTTQAAIDALKKANPTWKDADLDKVLLDASRVNAFNNKVKSDGSYLTPQEEIIYAQGKMNELSGKEADAIYKLNQSIYKNQSSEMRSNTYRSMMVNHKGTKEIDESKKMLKDLGWSDEKIEEYSLLAERIQSAKATEDYNKQFDIDPNASASEKFLKSARNTAVDLLYSPVEGISGLLSNLEKKPEGFGRNMYSRNNLYQNASDYATEQVVNNAIGDEPTTKAGEWVKEKTGQTLGQWAYQTGLSTAESLENMLIARGVGNALGVTGAGAALKAAEAPTTAMKAAAVGEKAVEMGSLVPFGASAYNEGYKDARERGATDRQAQLYGIASGAAEMGTEVLSLDHLWSMADGTKVGKNILVNWLAQAGIEGSEEAASDLLNRYSDYLVLGKDGKNQMTIDIQNYMDQGYTEEEAKKRAEKDFWIQVGSDALSGAVSGGLSGGAAVVAGYANANQNKQMNQNISDYMNNRLMNQDYDENITQEKAEKYAKNPTQYIADSISEDTEETRQAKQTIQEYANKVDNGGKLTASERNDIENNMYEAATAQDRYNRYMDEISKDPNANINDAYKVNIKVAMETLRNQYNGDQSQFINETAKNLPSESQETYTNLYEENKEKVNAAQFEVAFNRFFRAGQNNIDFESQLNENNKIYSEILGEDTVRAMYDAGVSQAKIDGLNQIENTIKEDPNVGKIGKVIDNGSVKLSDDQAAGLDMIAKTVGLDIEINDASEGNERASYSLKNGKITLTANNVSSVFHELGHYMKDFAPSEYNDLKMGMLNAYVESVGSNSFNNEYQKYVNAYGEINANEITDEMANSMFVGLMSSENGQEAFTKFLNNNYKPNQVQKIVNSIKEFFDRAFAALRNMFSNSDMSQMERNTYKAKIDAKEKLINDYISTLQAAVENKNAQNGENNAQNVAENGQKSKIKKGMSSNERYEILKNDVIDIKRVNQNEINSVIQNEKISLEELETEAISKAESSIKTLAKNIGVIRNGYTNKNIDIEFNYTNASLNETLNKQVGKQGRRFSDFVKMLVNFEDIVSNAKLIKVEDNEYQGESKYDPDNTNVYHLISAFEDGERIVPVKLIIKEFEKKENKLHVSITIPSIKKAAIISLEPQTNVTHKPTQAFYTYKLADLLSSVKNDPSSEDLGKRIPEEFLNGDDTKSSLNVDNEGNTLSEGQKEYFKNAKTVDENGNLKVLYHGTGRADRVGYYFNPERATSGPMAFFTDNKTIADNYSKDKADTSISRDERYDSYYTQFRMNIDGKDMSIGEAWDELPARKRSEIRQKAPHITFDDDYENIIYDESKQNGLGNFDKYLLSEHKNNYLEALVDAWLEQGDLYGDEARFKEVLSLVGIDNAEYLDPDFRDEKVYETYLNITNPFNAVTQANEDFVEDFSSWYEEQEKDQYKLEMYSADMWDKSNMSIESWLDKVNNDIENGTTHAWTVIPDAVTDYLKENGYDGIEDQGGKSGGEGHTVYIPFYSNQIKSIDNLNPTDDLDIRYSWNVDDYFVLDDYVEEESDVTPIMQNTTSILEEGMEALKGQEVDKTKVNRIATKLRNEFKSTIKHKTFSYQIEKVFAYMQNTEHVNYNDMMRILSEVARPVLEQSTEKVGTEVYNNFRDVLKGYKISLNETQKQEVANVFGSYNNFRKAMMPVTLSNEGSSLDSIWSELVDRTGGILDMTQNDADQPLALYDTLQALKPTVENIYGGSLEDASRDLAMRIVEEYFSEQADEKSKETVQKLKQQTKDYEKKLRETYAERYKEVKEGMSKMQKLRDTAYAEQIASIKAKNKKTAEKQRQRNEVNHEKDMVEKEIKRLAKWIEKPTEQNHVPSEMVEPILEFMNALDWVEPDIRMNSKGNYVVRVFTHSEIVDGVRRPVFETIEDTDRSEVLRRYRNAVGVGAGSQNARSWVDRMNLMKDLLNQAKDGDVFKDSDMNSFLTNIDPTLATQFSDLLKRNKNVLSVKQLSASDFNILKNTLKGISHAIQTRNKAVAQKGEISAWANSTIERAKKIKLKPHSKFVNAAMKNLGLDMMTPDTFFYFQGEGGQAIMTGLNNGFDIKVRDIQNTQKYMQEVLKDVKSKTLDEWRGNNAKVYSFPVFDGEVRMTKAQIMYMFEVFKRDQALLHLKGGVKVTNIRIKGKEYRQNEPVHLSSLDLSKIFSVLTDEDKQVADGMQWYLANECSKWGNEASKKMYGYEKFLEKKYMPIKTDADSNAIRNNGDTIETLNSIERSGFTKNLTDYAANAIMIPDIFDVFEEHVEGMAAYHGYAPAIKDTIRWMNYNEVFQMENNDEFNVTDSVKRAINNNLGRADNEGIQYLKKFLKDLNGSEKASGIQSLPDYLVSSYKAAAIGGNLRVVIQQPTAYFRALNEISPKYLFSPATLAKSLPGVASKNIDRIKEISPTVWWKTQGFYETSLGRSLDEMITGQQTVRDKLTEASMFLAGKADDITWSALYTAVEKEQRAKLKNENLSEDEFKDRVNERFNQVIARTQVVDSTLQKSQWMRSKDKLDKLRTAFMAEPTKSYNMAMKSLIDDYQNNGANVLKWKSTRKAVAVLMITDIANSVAQALIDGLRYKDDDDYWETWLEYFKNNLADNVNPLNRIPVMKDISDKIISLISGENQYGQNSDMSDQALSDILKVFTTWQKRAEEGILDKPLTYNEYKVYAKAISSLTGVPLYNVSREVMSIHNMVSDDPWGKKESSNKYSDVKNAIKMDRSQDKIEAQLQKVLENNGNLADYESMVQGMFKSDYLDAKDSDNTESMESIKEKAIKAYMAGGRTESEAKAIIDEWSPAKYGMSNLYKEIADGGDIKGSVKRLLDEGKEPYDIVEKLVEKYDDTISYNQKNGIESEIDENVLEALRAVNRSYTYRTAKEEVRKVQKEKAEAKAAKEAKAQSKKAVYDAIDTGSDYKKSLKAYYDAGYNLSDLKGDLTSDYVKPSIAKYYTGNQEEKANAQKTLNRIATIKATIDEAKGTKIAKKYGGDYYAYEMDEIMDMIEKYKEEPWK